MQAQTASLTLKDALYSHLKKLDPPTISLLALQCAIDTSEVSFFLSLDHEEKIYVIRDHLIENYRSNHLAKILGLPAQHLRSLKQSITG